MIKYWEFIIISNYEGNLLILTDAETWKHGDQTGLDTLLVRAVNDEY